MSLSYKEVAEIIRIIDSSSCDELVFEAGDVKLHVRRRASGTPSVAMGGETGPVDPAPVRPGPAGSTSATGKAIGRDAGWGAPAQAPPGRSATAGPEHAPVVSPDTGARPDGLVEVRSPMVGTFYRRPSPDADRFAEVGAEVEEGTPLCLIEVMKLFTTLYTPAPGRIADVSAEEAQMVEYDQLLFLIEPR